MVNLGKVTLFIGSESSNLSVQNFGSSHVFNSVYFIIKVHKDTLKNYIFKQLVHLRKANFIQVKNVVIGCFQNTSTYHEYSKFLQEMFLFCFGFFFSSESALYVLK